MIECLRYREINKGCLQGYADIYIQAWDAEINGCKLWRKGSQEWISLPDKEIDGNDGEKRYYPVIRLRTKEANERLKEAIRQAIHDHIASRSNHQQQQCYANQEPVKQLYNVQQPAQATWGESNNGVPF